MVGIFYSFIFGYPDTLQVGEEMKIRIKKFFSFIILIFLCLFLFFTLIFFYEKSLVPQDEIRNKTVFIKENIIYKYEITRYPARVETANLLLPNSSKIIGISNDPWFFDFGLIPIGPGNYAQKTVNLANKGNSSVRVILKAFGNISNMVLFEKNNFNLIGNDTVNVILNVTEDIPQGNYTGEIDIIIRKGRW